MDAGSWHCAKKIVPRLAQVICSSSPAQHCLMHVLHTWQKYSWKVAKLNSRACIIRIFYSTDMTWHIYSIKVIQQLSHQNHQTGGYYPGESPCHCSLRSMVMVKMPVLRSCQQKFSLLRFPSRHWSVLCIAAFSSCSYTSERSNPVTAHSHQKWRKLRVIKTFKVTYNCCWVWVQTKFLTELLCM